MCAFHTFTTSPTLSFYVPLAGKCWN